MRRSSLWAFVLSLSATAIRGIDAQCPDGTPPPCGARRTQVAAIDSTAIVILPFSLRGPSELQYLGPGMVDLLQNGIDAVGGYRVIQPSASQRDLRSPGNAADVATSVRASGARFVVTGSVVAVGPDLRVNAELYDAVKRRRVVPVNARTDLTQLGRTTDSIALVMFSRGGTASSRSAQISAALGSSTASGKVAPDQRLLITEFRSAAEDSGQARLAADALRISLTQSGFVRVMQPEAVGNALRRMRREPTEKLTPEVARELSRREGVALLGDGDVSRNDRGLVFVVRITEAESGATLAVAPANAATIADIPDAMDGLARRLRTKLGESLQKIQSSPPRAQVTTSSVAALEKYTAGARANDVERDFPKAVALLKEAVRIDTAFSEAWRKLAAASANGNIATPSEIDGYRTRAFLHRDRLSPVERVRAEITYYGRRDEHRQQAAWEEMFRLTNDSAIFGALSAFHLAHREYARAASAANTAIRANPEATEGSVQTLVNALLWQGRTREADSVIRALSEKSLTQAVLKLRYDCLRDLVHACGPMLHRLDSLRAGGNPEQRAQSLASLTDWALLRGQVRQAQSLRDELNTLNRARGVISRTPGPSEIYFANGIDLSVRDDPSPVGARLDSADLSDFEGRARPLVEMAKHYAWGKRPDRARAMLARARKAEPDSAMDQVTRMNIVWTEAEIALAEGRWNDAIKQFRAVDIMPYRFTGACNTCIHDKIGRVYEAAGLLDSALAAYERSASPPATLGDIPWQSTVRYERLCKLYAKTGNYTKAALYCAMFVQLWEHADPELQPRVTEARRILARGKTSANHALKESRFGD